MIQTLVAAVVASTILTACVGTEVRTTVPFNATEVAYINKSGSGRVTGQAFRRQQGGGVVTCAGGEVMLIPAGRYARERFSQIYGSESGGSNSVWEGAKDFGDPQYVAMTKKAQCDAEGDFEFTNVAEGDYYVMGCVSWIIGYSPQGGCSAKLIRVRDGEDVKVLLS